MPYCLLEVTTAEYPNAEIVARALSDAGLSTSDVVETVRRFVCTRELQPDAGYQMAIARELEYYLSEELVSPPLRSPGSSRYSPNLNEEADVAIAAQDGRHLYIEIEFRPNVEKDLVKFQIGANSGRLLAAVLIVAIDRTAVNVGYTSMPEFRKVSKVITELNPAYPLLLIGIRGEHTTRNAAVFGGNES